MTGTTPRVTVIVPTFNSGRHLGELIASLDRQSLSPEEFEVVLVDDGSSDGTETLVDRIAEARPNVRSTHIPASGWPGRPRNVGLDEARGRVRLLRRPRRPPRRRGARADDRLRPRARLGRGDRPRGPGRAWPAGSPAVREEPPQGRRSRGSRCGASGRRTRCSGGSSCSTPGSASPRGRGVSRTTRSSSLPTSRRRRSRCWPTIPATSGCSTTTASTALRGSTRTRTTRFSRRCSTSSRTTPRRDRSATSCSPTRTAPRCSPSSTGRWTTGSPLPVTPCCATRPSWPGPGSPTPTRTCHVRAGCSPTWCGPGGPRTCSPSPGCCEG